MLFEDPWFLRALFDLLPNADLLRLVQAAGFIDRALGQWCGLSNEPIVLDQSVVKGLCSSLMLPRKITADWRIFFWRCLRALSAHFGGGAILSSKEIVGEWFKVGDDIAGDMLIAQEDLNGNAWQGIHDRSTGVVFGHTIVFHLFRFDPDEVKDVFGNPGDGDEGYACCSSDSAFIQHPFYGPCSLQFELSCVEDGFVLYLETQSVAERRVIETKQDVNLICPVTPTCYRNGTQWHILDKYSYCPNPEPHAADTHFHLRQNCSNYTELVRGLQGGLPLPLLISTSGPMLPEEEEDVMRMFM